MTGSAAEATAVLEVCGNFVLSKDSVVRLRRGEGVVGNVVAVLTAEASPGRLRCAVPKAFSLFVACKRHTDPMPLLDVWRHP